MNEHDKCKPEAKTWFKCRGHSCVNSVGFDFTEIWYQGVDYINSVELLWTLLPLDCILLLGLQTCVILVSADFTSYDVRAFCTEMNVYFLVILLFVACRRSFFSCGRSVFCILLCYHTYHICSVEVQGGPRKSSPPSVLHVSLWYYLWRYYVYCVEFLNS